MPGHDLIVVGASAGGVEALSALVAGLPAELPAAVCVVVHLRPYADSRLADVLARAGVLPAVAARNGMALQPGTVYVAVPDMHLLVERDGAGGMLRLVRGPRENRARPAIDPLFRSAALAYGPRVIGVVLSGALDDGTAGLWTVKDRGGITVVQDPADAAVSSMPASALAEVGADHIATARELGPLLDRLARELVPADATREAATDDPPHEPIAELVREVAITAIDEGAHQDEARYGTPSRFPCPDCSGVLWDVSGDGPLRFRCEVGHAHSAASLAEVQTDAVETALWAALRAIEDRVALARVRATAAETRGLTAFVEQFTVQQQAAEQNAAAIRAVLRLDGRSGVRPRTALAGTSSQRPAGAEAGSRGTADERGD